MTWKPKASPWTDEAIAELRRLWPDSTHSAAAIARGLGPAFTRNAVIAKAKRLGLAPREEPAMLAGRAAGRAAAGRKHPKPKRKRTKAKRRRERMVDKATPVGPILAGILTGPLEGESAPAPSLPRLRRPPRLVSVLDMAWPLYPSPHRECQFPIGEPGTAGFRMCGLKPTWRGTSYCVVHAATCWGLSLPEDADTRRRLGLAPLPMPATKNAPPLPMARSSL